VVRDAVFTPLDVPIDLINPPAAISMNHGTAPGDAEPRDPILVYNFNAKPGDDFRVYYSLDVKTPAAPCHDTRPQIEGWTCR
jgi:hypothetical protein